MQGASAEPGAVRRQRASADWWKPAGADQLVIVSEGSRRLPALDGLRGLAVAAVLAYHLDVPRLGGGFVGVDLFFVLSGYLITALLLREHERAGTISLVGFWGRRIRRLWPVAWLVLAAVALAGAGGVWAIDRQALLGKETFAALANVYNWWQMANGGYVAQFIAPSPLRHFWSLAIEEQFYLVWPPVLVGLLALARRWRPAAVWVGLGAIGLASIIAGWMSGPAEAYLGTLTRAIALVAGAALAFAFRRTPMAAPKTTRWQRVIVAWSVTGTTALVAVAVFGDPEAIWLHRGGFTVIAVSCAGVVAGALCPLRSTNLLRSRPVVWLGERSYAIYLIHWPLIVAVGAEASLARRTILVVPATLVAAHLVRRLVERPVIARRFAARTLSVAGVGVLLVTLAASRAAEPTGPTGIERAAATLDAVADPVARSSKATLADGTSTSTSTTVPCQPAAIGPAFGDASGFDPSTVADVGDPAAACGEPVRVLVVGDSLARGISNGLRAGDDRRIEVWDRSRLGCSIGGDNCDDWRTRWSEAISTVKPDVVLYQSNAVTGPDGSDPAAFPTEIGRSRREAVLLEAVSILARDRATVLLSTTAPPDPALGLYYCKGQATESACDPNWVQAWNQTVRDVAARSGSRVVDAAGWIAARGADPEARPDGLHLSGTALSHYARWLVPQLVVAERSGPPD